MSLNKNACGKADDEEPERPALSCCLIMYFAVHMQHTMHFSHAITKTRLFKYIENFTTIKIENFQIKNPDIFHNSAPNIDCGYSLEPPRRGGSNEYPQSMFWTEIRKIMYNPVNPVLLYKSGV